MELRSPTETKNSKLPQWLFWPLLVVCLLPAVFFMHMDTWRTGDEIITYGMANEPEQGWMFSKGRIRTYLDTEIFGEGMTKVPGNLLAAARDVLANRRNAAFFQMERPGETGWYSGEQMRDYLAITEGEAFRPGDIYLNAMGDDANSFLYYLCLHMVSSLFPMISAGKWSGFLLNLLCLAAALLLLERISSYFVKTAGIRYLILLAYGCSAAAIDVFTNIRPYALTVVMQEALLLLHLKMLKNLRENGVSAAKACYKWLLIVYVLGYVSHYTTGIWAVCLAVFTIAMAYPEKGFLRSYILTGILAVVLGIVVDPVSVLGLLSKLKGSESTGLAAAYLSMLKTWVQGICGNPLWLLPAVTAVGIALWRYRMTESATFPRKEALFAALPVTYMLLSTLLMKSVKIGTVLPCFFVLGGMLLSSAAGEEKRWKKILTAVCFVLWAGGMFAQIAQGKKEERKAYLLLEEQMAMYGKEQLLFVRDHGAGYDKIPLLGNYERIYLWTVEEDRTEEEEEAFLQAVGSGGPVLLDGDAKQLKEMTEELLRRGGYTPQIVLENEQSILLYVK